jgi:thiol reductant ABC exporter CydC subunit
MKGTFGRLLKLTAPFAGRMALATLLGVATIASSVGLMTTSAYIIARAALRPSIAELQVAIVGVRFFGIARGGFRYLERYLSHQVTFRLLARLRVWFYTALEPLAPARLLHYRSGDLFSRITADVETLEDFYLRVLAPPAIAFLIVLLVVSFVGSFDPALGGALLFFLLLAGVALPILTRALSRRAGRQMVRVRTDLNSVVADGIQGVADLLAYGQEKRHCEQVRSLDRTYGRLQGQMARTSGLHTALSGLAMNLATLAVLVLAIPLVRGGTLDGVYLALLVLAAISGFEAVLPLPQAFQYLEHSLEAARRLFEIVDAEPAIVDRPEPAISPGEEPSPAPNLETRGHGSAPGAAPIVPGAPVSYDLCVEDLCFAYDAGSPPVLEDVNFHLAQGKRLAIVGPSGAGKTTLVRLLLRFWDPTSGRILLGGRALGEYGQEQVRKTMAVVSQNTHLFTTTVRENLLLSRPGATEAEMKEAARQAQIHDFIQSLPQGYDTWIGEQGLQLSGGQRQRLAIARALLKDAPILILDEPTTNLDALTERDVLAALEILTMNRTSLIVSHRLAGLEAVDEILVFKAGRIVERGRHRDLVAQGGRYRRMWDLQREVLDLKA